MLDIVAVGCGGFIGAVLRYLIGLIPVNESTVFPIKTFLINVVGCILIGLIAVYAGKHAEVNPKLILFLKVGICGGFTTFSSFALESTDLIKGGHAGVAVLYVLLSVIVGVSVIMGTEILVGK